MANYGQSHKREVTTSTYAKETSYVKYWKVRWPQKNINDELYKKTWQKPWSYTIRTRIIGWLGHLPRLPKGAPAKQALEIYLNYPAKHPSGPEKCHGLILSKKTSKHMLALHLINV
ncbi:hypothetical protein EB796_023581 [Bugula neritina]|uniref:Uncharacterized protein n=1 Tax=Bugula neritina TaxID=10212 RepID=A0A7J7IW30_BUGNE|nr:hypothetical protein EB796_023581 [Bugula neritina]